MFSPIALILFAIGFWNIHRYKTTITHYWQVTAVLSELRYTPLMNGFRSKTCPVFKYSLNGAEYETEYQYQAISGSLIKSCLEKDGLEKGHFLNGLVLCLNNQSLWLDKHTGSMSIQINLVKYICMVKMCLLRKQNGSYWVNPIG